MEYLTAGAIRLKFQDGQLRYLYVGRREIIRRIYFALRDEVMDTIMPTLSRVEVTRLPGGFRVAFRADYKSGQIDYGMDARIEGAADGTITFQTDGCANSPFRSPRIGLCVLYGSSLAGVEFEAVDAGGKAVAGRFPRDISPTSLADNFQTLRYSDGGMTVSCSLDGGTFSMEDQRIFGDSSYKAYGAIPYAYPEVDTGAKSSHLVRIRVAKCVEGILPACVAGVPPASCCCCFCCCPEEETERDGEDAGKMPATHEGETPSTHTSGTPATRTTQPARIVIGGAMKGVRLPRVLGHFDKPPAGAVIMSYSPALHLFDDDMLIENPPALADMVRLRRKEAVASPSAPLVVRPVTIEPPYPRPARDPRNVALFGAAWSVWFLKCAALAGVDAVRFDVGPGPAARVQEELAALGGSTMLETAVESPAPAPVDALALEYDGGKTVYLVNKTSQPQQADLCGPIQLEPFEVRRIGN